MIALLREAVAGGEVRLLKHLAEAGLPVVETWVLEDLETEFYQLNNLPERIQRSFRGIFSARIDERRLEAAARETQNLIRETYLLPERSDQLAAKLVGKSWVVRYAGGEVYAHAPGACEVLVCIKQLWTSVWMVDTLLERAPELAPPERPTLVQVVGESLERDSALEAVAKDLLGSTVRIYAEASRVVRVVPAEN